MNMDLFFTDYLKLYKDASDAAKKAIASLRDGDTLFLEGKEIHFYPDNAQKRAFYISNNDSGEKLVAFLMENKKNITIDGNAASLIFHGEILPFAVSNCENVTIRNLSIDYAEAMYFSGTVCSSGMDHIELKYNSDLFHCETENGQIHFYGENWEKSPNRVLVNEFDEIYCGPTPNTPTYFACFTPSASEDFHRDICKNVRAESISIDRIWFSGDIGYCHEVGKQWLCTFMDRAYPGIFCQYSKNIYFSDIKIFHALSMGLICQVCENVSLFGIKIMPNKGRILSTNADATHFVNCSGLIHINNCRFESMMDDAVNIHGMYLPIAERKCAHSVQLTYGHPQQQGVQIFKPGDRIRIVNGKSLMPLQELTVQSCTQLEMNRIELNTVESIMEKIPQHSVVENVTAMPQVHIENCASGYNRPRGFLLSTNRDVLVERCKFYNLNFAVSLTGDALDWYESGASGDVVLRNNVFDNSSYAGSAVIQTQSKITENFGQFYHKSLTVENNVFRTNGKRFLNVSHVGEISFRGNIYQEDKTLSGANTLENGGFMLTDCGNAHIEPCKEANI